MATSLSVLWTNSQGGQASLHRLSAGQYAAWQNLHQASAGQQQAECFYQACQEGGIYIAAKAAAYLASLVEPVTAKDSDAEPVAGTHPLYQASGGVIVLDNEDVQTSGAYSSLHRPASYNVNDGDWHKACSDSWNKGPVSVTGPEHLAPSLSTEQDFNLKSIEQDSSMKGVAMVTSKEETDKCQGIIHRKKLLKAFRILC